MAFGIDDAFVGAIHGTNLTKWLGKQFEYWRLDVAVRAAAPRGNIVDPRYPKSNIVPIAIAAYLERPRQGGYSKLIAI